MAIVPGLLFAMLLSSLSQGTVVTALPAIGKDLGNAELLPWLMTAYLVAATVSIPLFGKLADSWGRRNVLMTALGIFIAGSAVCALCTSMNSLIIGRALQGAGGGSLIALCLTVMADIIPPIERARYQILFSSFYLVGSLGGPIVGGLVVQSFDWSMIFWLNVPCGFLALGMCAYALRSLPQNHRPQPLDIPGAVMLTAATVIMLLAISGGERAAYQTIAMLAASAAIWMLFALWLLRTPSPLIALHLLQDPVIRNSTLSAALGSAALLVITVYFPMYLQTIVGMTPSASGFALMPLILGATLGGVLAGQMMPRILHYRRIAVCGLIISAACAALMAVGIAFSAPISWLLVLSMGAGAGAGTMPPVTTISAQNSAAPNEMGIVTAANNYTRQLGSTVLVSVMGTLLASAGIKASVEGGPSIPASALNLAFAWVCAGASLATFVGLFFLLRMEEKPLRTHLPSQA